MPVAALDSAAPTTRRAPALDAVRGLAILGVLLINMDFYRGPRFHLGHQGFLEHGALGDRVSDFALTSLAQGKAYTTLSFLFGYGAMLQLRRTGGVPRFLRRSAGLLVLGAVHGVVLFGGDILTLYALCGLVVLVLRKAPTVMLLSGGVSLYLYYVLIEAAGVNLTAGDSFAERDRDATEALVAYGGGGPGAAIEQHVEEIGVLWSQVYPTFGLGVIAVFLIGAAAARAGALTDPAAHPVLWRRVLLAGLAIGIPANIGFALAYGLDYEPTALTDFLSRGLQAGAPAPLAAAYIAAIALLVARGSPLRPLTPVGRLALSCYIGQSLIAVFLFTGFGLGKYGDWGPATGVALSLALFAAQIALCGLWLRRFRFGPLEWLLRSWTYGRRQPLRG